MLNSYSIIPVIAVALVAPAVLHAQEAPKSADEAAQGAVLLLKASLEVVKSIKDAASGEKAVPLLSDINKKGRVLENYFDKLPDLETEAAFKKVATEIQALMPQLIESIGLINEAQYYGDQKLKHQIRLLMEEADDSADEAKDAIIGDDDNDDDKD